MRGLIGFAALLTLLFVHVDAAGAESQGEPPILGPLGHARVVTPVVQSYDAQRLFADVNAARAAHGLPTLTPDTRLDAFALTVAQQMATRNYFGHTDPDGVTFDQRIRAARIAFRFAAENMAFDQTEPHANLMLLHSPGHYANIMDPQARHLGVAAVGAGPDGVFYVEEFTN